MSKERHASVSPARDLGLTDVNLAHAQAVYTMLFFLPPRWGIQKEPGDEARWVHDFRGIGKSCKGLK